MIRNTAREIAVHLAYELSFTDKTVKELLDERLTKEYFDTLKDEDDIYEKAPGAAQTEYIRSIVSGVAEHAPELDGYIAKYAKGWSFDRIPLVASAIMRVAMYESLYRSDIPTRVAVNEAVEIAKKYETPETVKFINGILGSFVRGEISAAEAARAINSTAARSARNKALPQKAEYRQALCFSSVFHFVLREG